MFVYLKSMEIGVYSTPLFEKIIADDKWYAAIPVGEGYMTSQHANGIKNRFYDGTLKLKTLAWIFGYFGYEIKEKEIVWIRKN